ncbi:PREDICTED: vinorine synthase-like [Ipomoea nil]|uniref:vinorine synthase-like n=1 Tax=Ipomoea nil TaxID=35883 RepID=UPI000900A7E2|nr:PREDICTED: vinorine synthase-like [Ipomoea nil]XP_019155481.1 PREDICTED: vinorine synthase-like [Ipomoea nil]
MKIEVRRRDIIKPSSPTPQSLRTYNFSIVDQLSVNVKIPYVRFYDSPGSSRDYNGVVDELKKSLSQTLSLMYPLAGRIKEDRSSIECNDQGVEFIEGDVAESLSSFLENPDFEMIREMVPCNPFTGAFEPNPDGRVLVIQVNRFSCGGISVGLIMSHAIGDGASISVFANTWARINRGCAVVDDGGFIFDASKIFPPVKNTADLDQFARVARGAAESQEKYVVRRFYIPASAIDQLREQLRLISHYRPSRAEALIAVVWDAVIAANQKRHKGRINLHVLTSILNLRNRMEPPFPENCLGNNTYGATVHWNQPTEGNPSRHALALKFRDAIRGVNDEAARRRYGKGGFLHTALPIMSEIIKHEGSKKNMYCLYTSSLLGMQVYAADFGWGKPRWAVNAQVMKDSVVFMEGRFGGVDLWMGLPEELMNIVMKNPQFVEFVSAGFSKSKL